jgi:hypothetical protein
VSLVPGSIKISRCGGVAAHWARVIERCETGGEDVQTLKRDGGASVFALPGESGSAGLVAKRWELRSVGSRLKSLVHASRAWRHWNGAERLSRAGVRTAACFAIGRSRDAETGVGVEWLIMDRLLGKMLLRHMADNDLPVQTQHRLAESAGRMVAALVKAGLYNHDGKPANLIVSPDPQRSLAPQISIIDCVAIRKLPKVGVEGKIIHMLAGLVIEPIGCKCPPRRALMMRALKSFANTEHLSRAQWRGPRNRTWHAVAAFIEAHGDPSPKVNPLT